MIAYHHERRKLNAVICYGRPHTQRACSFARTAEGGGPERSFGRYDVVAFSTGPSDGLCPALALYVLVHSSCLESARFQISIAHIITSSRQLVEILPGRALNTLCSMRLAPQSARTMLAEFMLSQVHGQSVAAMMNLYSRPAAPSLEVPCNSTSPFT